MREETSECRRAAVTGYEATRTSFNGDKFYFNNCVLAVASWRSAKHFLMLPVPQTQLWPTDQYVQFSPQGYLQESIRKWLLLWSTPTPALWSIGGGGSLEKRVKILFCQHKTSTTEWQFKKKMPFLLSLSISNWSDFARCFLKHGRRQSVWDSETSSNHIAPILQYFSNAGCDDGVKNPTAPAEVQELRILHFDWLNMCIFGLLNQSLPI